MNVLKTICARRRKQVAVRRRAVPIEVLRSEHKPYHAPTRSLREAVRTPGLSIIAEHKRASPSQGSYGISQSPEQIASAYRDAGACAISVLTEPDDFGGSLEHLRAIRAVVDVPLLRKDFIVEPYQLHEAKAYGADAVLLIAAALSLTEADELRVAAHHIGLEVLLELHSEAELDYLTIGPDVVGINNRDLTTLEIDVNTSVRLAKSLPSELTKISESGLSSPDQLNLLAQAGYDGFLMGTAFMKAKDPGRALSLLFREFDQLSPAS